VNWLERSTGERLRAELRVPDAAPFFGDHFPRRPVFPGTLLMEPFDAAHNSREAPSLQDTELAPLKFTDVKIRSFWRRGSRTGRSAVGDCGPPGETRGAPTARVLQHASKSRGE
jgi:hypothetical protein